MEALYAVIFAIKDLNRWEIKKVSIINGIIWFIFWSIVGYFSWDVIFRFTTLLIDFIPFNFLKISGTYILYTILWIQAVLITVGVVFALINEVLEREAIKKHIHYIGIVSIIISALFWSFIFLFFEGRITSYIEHIIRFFPFETLKELMSGFLAALYLYLLYTASIFISSVFFLIPKIEKLSKEEYPSVEVKQISPTSLLSGFLKDFIIFLVLAVILYPLMLVPVVNIITVVFLTVLLIENTYKYIVKSMFEKEISKKDIWIISIFSALLNIVPVFNIFAPALELLSLYHFALEKEISEEIKELGI